MQQSRIKSGFLGGLKCFLVVVLNWLLSSDELMLYKLLQA